MRVRHGEIAGPDQVLEIESGEVTVHCREVPLFFSWLHANSTGYPQFSGKMTLGGHLSGTMYNRILLGVSAFHAARTASESNGQVTDNRWEKSNNSDNPMYKKDKISINAKYWHQLAAISRYVVTGNKEYSPCKPC